MIPPCRRLPTAPILEVSAIALCHTMAHDPRNMEMKFFFVKLIFSLFYIVLFYRPLTGALEAKGQVF
jgi:hypothetical protein